MSSEISKKQSDIVPFDRTYEDLFKEISELNDKNIIVRGDCKFCNHPARHQAERKWETAGYSFALVKKFFEKWETENPNVYPMNAQNIRNHLLNHYAKQEQQLWISEYARDIRSYMNSKISQDHRFEMLRGVLEKQLFEIGSNPRLDILKKTDQMVKVSKMILEIDECQAKLRGDLKPVNVITERFMSVWLHIINNESDQNVKVGLLKALDAFQENMQEGVVVE